MKLDRSMAGELAGSTGAACLVAGAVLYSMQGGFQPLNRALLIVGGVLVLAWVALGFPRILNFFSKRSSRLGTNMAVLGLAVVAILGIVNYLGFQHHKRFDLTSEKLFTLSDQTRKIAGSLTKDVTIVRFAKTPDATLDDLMAEYKSLSPHIKFQTVDPQEKPDVAREYGIAHVGDVVAASGPRKENIQPNPEGGFQEEDISSALLKVTREKVKMICFTTGHGEKSLSDDAESGYAQVDAGLKKEGYNTDSVNLVSSGSVPASCDVLVIAGPTQALFPQEAAMVSKYLDGGGKALIEVDPETDPKLDDILKPWNVDVGQNVVVDVSGVGRMFGTGPAVPLVVDYGDSPITKNLKNGMTFFPLARTVTVADKQKVDAQGTEILKTSQSSFTIPNLKEKEVKYDPKRDTAGPLSMGVSATRSGDAGARLVVIGDSDFAGNKWVTMQHNGDLFFNTIDWLAQDENLISIRPKAAASRTVTLTEGQEVGFRWLNLIFLPGFVIVLGVSIWWKRR